jgi:hypothetical protein
VSIIREAIRKTFYKWFKALQRLQNHVKSPYNLYKGCSLPYNKVVHQRLWRYWTRCYPVGSGAGKNGILASGV